MATDEPELLLDVQERQHYIAEVHALIPGLRDEELMALYVAIEGDHRLIECGHLGMFIGMNDPLHEGDCAACDHIRWTHELRQEELREERRQAEER
jgi:hypothetical protein